MQLRRLFVLSLLLRCIVPHCCIAQSIVFQQAAAESNILSHSQSLGRDFWVAPSAVLYVGANFLGTAYVQFPGKPILPITVSPNGPVTVPVPNELLIQSSDSVERKYVHIWSTSVDLMVSSFLLQAPYNLDRAQDGTNIPPVGAWDTEYVVAAGGPTFRGSSFTIAAAFDSTIVTITPSCDLARTASLRDALGHKAHVPFSMILNRGESVQFSQYGDSGVTGTALRSSKPIGVAGRTSFDANFNSVVSFESMLPKRSWGNTYYTPPYGKILLLFVASRDSQVIRRYDRTFMGLTNYLTIARKNEAVWVDIVDSGCRWESDDPFMLEMMTTAAGAPSVMLTAREHYEKRIGFYAIPGHGMTYNVFVSRKSAFATLDGVSIADWPHVHIDSFYDCYSNNVWPTATTHALQSDQPLFAFAAASNNYYLSSYALSASSGLTSSEQTDTTAPTVSFDTTHYCAYVHVSDHDSKLSAIIPDTVSNFAIDWDTSAHAVVDSSGVALPVPYVLTADSTSLRICLLDSLETASYGFTAFDVAGNSTHYTIHYTPNARFFHPGCITTLRGLDSCIVDQFQDFEITITDTSLMRVEIDNVWTDSPNFIFDRTWLATNAVPFSVYPEGSHTISLRFAPKASQEYNAHAFLHGPFVGTVEVPLHGVGYPWVVGPVDAVREHAADTIEIYPNPASTFLQIRGTSEQTSFELFDLLGQRVLSTKPAANRIELPLLSNGIYAYRIARGTTVKTGRLSISRQ